MAEKLNFVGLEKLITNLAAIIGPSIADRPYMTTFNFIPDLLNISLRRVGRLIPGMAESPIYGTFSDTPNGDTSSSDESEDETVKPNLRHRVKREIEEKPATGNATLKKRKSSSSRSQPKSTT